MITLQMGKNFGIHTKEGMPVMAQRGKRIAPITFSVELETLPTQMHGAFINRRYHNTCEVYGLTPDNFICKEVTE